MFKKYRQLIIGIILGALIFGSISVASNGLKSIDVMYNNIKIAVDGKEVKTDSEPFIYKGRTYVPIRVVSEALGAEVGWNDKTKTVEIFKDKKLQPSKEVNVEEKVTIGNATELKKHLTQNYSSLDTIIGKTNFSFEVEENTTIGKPYDFRIKVYFDDKYFHEAYTSLKYTKEQKSTLAKQLREHQKNIAITSIKSMPTKKFYGSYYDGFWKYPSLEIDWQEVNYCSWINFTLNHWNSVVLLSYDDAKLSDFKWHSEFMYNTFFGEEDPPIEN